MRGILGKRVRKRISQPSTLGELGAAIKRNEEGYLRSPYVTLLDVCVVVVLLAMTLEVDQHHHANISVLYSKTGVCRGIHFFLFLLYTKT